MLKCKFNLELFLRAIQLTQDQRDLSGKQVAFATGMTPDTYSRIMLGKLKNPGIHDMISLAYWAGINLHHYTVERNV